MWYILLFQINLFALSNQKIKTIWRHFRFVCLCVFQVFKLLTDLKEQRKDSGKNKHSIGQQNLNTIMYEVSTHPLCLHRPKPALWVCYSSSVPTVSSLFQYRRWSTCPRRLAAGRVQTLSKTSSPPWCLTNSQSQWALTRAF